jgi:hypothetical protein
MNKEEKSKTKSCSRTASSGGADFCCFALLASRHLKKKKSHSTECLQSDVRLEVSVQVKPFTYDVT